MKGLVIRSPWIDKILAGEKTWEMRSRNTSIRGRIALIRAGSGQIFGTAELVECLPALSGEQMRKTVHLHAIPESQLDQVLSNGWTTPWVLSDIVEFPTPLSYSHPNGAVTWVQLSDMPQVFATAQTNSSHRITANVPVNESLSDLNPRGAAIVEKTTASESWVDIPISLGNIRNNHFYLRSAQRLLPSNAIGGPNKAALAAHTISVAFEPGAVVETDIAGDKMILRARAQIGDFFARSDAEPGDNVRFSRQGSHSFLVTLIKSASK